MMQAKARRGQATVEFTLVIMSFVLLLFGTIEGARAVNMKDRLTRSAEAVAHDLAYTYPNLNLAFTLNPTESTSQSFVTAALADANKAGDFSLSFNNYSAVTAHNFYNASPSANDCSATSGAASTACQSVTSTDGNVVIVGFPSLSDTSTTAIRVTVCQPFSSVIGRFGFIARKDGKACETVTATTLACQATSTSC